MKTTLKFVLLLFATGLAVACNDIIENAEPNPFLEKEIVLTATREGLTPGTKSFRLDDGSVWWKPAEEVSVFYGSGSNGGSKFVSMNTSIAETVELQGSVQMSGSDKDFWAVCPYSEDNSCDGSSVTTVIPDQQSAVEGNFSNDVFPTIAKSSSLSLAFWNICGGIKFFVSGNDITSVTFKGNNSEPLAGKVKVSFDSNGKPYIAEVIDAKFEVTLNAPDGAFKVGKYYYITLLPASLQNGFTMTFETTDTRGSVVTQKAQIIKRSVFGVLKNIDSKVSEWESTVIVEPEWVDLGLSVKWATFNVGATKPEEYGDYFAWGETEPKEDYSWSTYKWGNGSNGELSKYSFHNHYGTVDYKTQLDPVDDAAHTHISGSWRIPTDAEWIELYENCTWTRTTNYDGTGVAGIVVTSRKTGYTDKTIFLPAAGNRVNKYVENTGDYCSYWSSSLSKTDPLQAYSLHTNKTSITSPEKTRFVGRSVRPVYGGNIPVSSLSLNETQLQLEPYNTYQLKATVRPADAISKDICWKSSNISIATVNADGLITAKRVGVVVITAYGSSGVCASCRVSVKPSTIPIVHEAVDLGLSVKWATCNVGATKPWEHGEYFSWGENEPKENYGWPYYKFEMGDNYFGPFSKYNRSDNKPVLDPEDDAAYVNWGGSWRMPTSDEFKELRSNCMRKWTETYEGNRISGWVYTSKIEGYSDKSIFLPASGRTAGGDLLYIYKIGNSGYYWSSSPCKDYSNTPWNAISFTFNAETSYSPGEYYRCVGMSVRPVCP